ncbi:pimeloyl-ACP methyl ester carboxylesterase [Antricoccus suffuscus]|uniref:Pimeloyl-ACP methyl ester carboxylesterase n=1 Tax=Antricoccus suffuscus TaxID=1629062 RepID=A0A2T0ZQH1_9ACTN|nr:alpha/beta hydrolase [Antricoccus suffuscus]PRZ38557.1 pimeloyl-ACP methyl ester carboxylesterase [Antricoccus suffuscus]
MSVSVPIARASSYDGEIVDPMSRRAPWPGAYRDITAPTAKGPRTIRLNFRETPGPDDLGRAFFVHGLGGSSTNFTEVATAMSGFMRGTSIDLPGYGVSDPAPGGDYSIDTQAAYVIASIEATGDGPVHLVGNSMGGLISVYVAARRPDLVRTLTLVSPAMPTYRYESGADPRMLLLAIPGLGSILQRQLALGDPHDRAWMSTQLCFEDPDRAPGFRVDQIASEVALRQRYPWSMHAFTESLRAIAATVVRRAGRTPWRLAAQITAPTLVVWGDRDKLVPARLAERCARTVQDGRLLMLSGVGHTAQLEMPEEAARAMLEMMIAR